jgi:thermitase
MISGNHKRGLAFPALFLALTLALFLSYPSPAAAAPASRSGNERILVGFRQPPAAAELDALRRTLESVLSRPIDPDELDLPLPNVARISAGQLPDLTVIRGALRSLSPVTFVEIDGEVSAFFNPDDPLYPRQWHLPSVSAPQAWDLTTGSTQVIIAVIDTGVDYNHPDLAGKTVAGYNFVSRNADPMDDNGHGTHVAGIAAASGNNALGVAGVDWSARIMPLKVLNAQGSGYESDVASAIRYAADHGARVINMSLGGPNDSYTVREAVNYAFNKGVTLVAAAGNNASSVSYPAACENVIAVGALDSQNGLLPYSNRGPALDLTAPGASILSTVPGGYQEMSGTSMASPVVAGCASLLLARNPSYSPSQVEKALEGGATDLGVAGFDSTFGYGKVNAYAALDSSQPDPGPEPPPGEDPQNPAGEGSLVWYLAEGYTGPGYQTYVLVQNPNAEAASLKAEYVDSSGSYIVEHYSLAGQSRLTLDLNAILPASEVSTCISSTNGVGVVVERSMYFKSDGRDDGHCSEGSTKISTEWYFAEGYTGPGFDQYILVLNPWFSENQLQLTLFDMSGGEQVYHYPLAPASRLTIHVNDLAPGRDVAAMISSAQGVVAERAMYFDYAGRDGGHCSLGSTSPSNIWFFAEGYTGPGFDEWLLLLNPGRDDRTATVTYRFNDGGQVVANYIVGARSRYSVHVNREAPERDVAIKVESGGEGLIAERAMYFNYRGAWDGGHCTQGSPRTGRRWNLAEGYTGSGFETWILIQNTSSYEAAEVTLAMMGSMGISTMHSLRLTPGSRTTIFLNDMVAPGDVSVSLYSSNNVPVVVERAMYFNKGGISGGSVSMGCP